MHIKIDHVSWQMPLGTMKKYPFGHATFRNEQIADAKMKGSLKNIAIKNFGL